MPSYITAIGTAVPRYKYSQSQIADFMAMALGMDDTQSRRLRALYRSTKIDTRYSVLGDYGQKPGDFNFFPNSSDLEPFPSVSARMQIYRQEALPLALEAVKDFDLAGITHLVTVSCTGMYAPGLDLNLVETLGLSPHTQRTAINFMGCYGAFNGLKVAQAITLANPEAKVLMVCLELCTLHFQKKSDDDFLLSNALFADGAATVLIEGKSKENTPSLEMKGFFCDVFSDGKDDMAWQIADFGFEMTLTSFIPKLIKQGIGKLVENLLANLQISRADISHYAIHPGGRAILEAIETALNLSPTDNRFAYNVLRQYGNMSSATVLFVLKELLEERSVNPSEQGHILSCAFGPGLTVEAMILK
jgi:alpha-pyrone synthase